MRVHYQTKAALHLPPSNQATAGLDFTPRDDAVVLADGATVALVTLTILPVSSGQS